jgi:hypothetical protein
LFATRSSELNGHRTQDLTPQTLPGTTVGHTFKHAAIDNDISMLYAWSCGKKVEELSTWHLNVGQGRSGIVLESRQRYHTVSDSEPGLVVLIHSKRTHGDFNATILPYNGRKGCAIRLDGDDCLFTSAEPSDSTLSLVTHRVSRGTKTCVHNGSSMLLIETSSITGTSVRERRITAAGSSIERNMQPLKTHINVAMDDIADMRMISMPPNDDPVFIAIAKNGRITLAPFKT